MHGDSMQSGRPNSVRSSDWLDFPDYVFELIFPGDEKDIYQPPDSSQANREEL